MAVDSKRKPRVFIGSSSEGRKVAGAIELHLSMVAEVLVWSEAFRLNDNYLRRLLTSLDEYDFAVLVLTGEDYGTIRGHEQKVPRDNVIFELGLFMGRIGSERTFFIPQEGIDLKVPSDLAGIKTKGYNPEREDKNLWAAVSPACTMITAEIERLGPRVLGDASNSTTALGVARETFFPRQGQFANDDFWLRVLEQADGEFDAMGLSLNGWRRTFKFREQALRKAEAGCVLRLLLMHDQHPALDNILYGFENEKPRGDLLHDLHSNYDFFSRLAREHENIQVRRIINGNASFFLTRTDKEAVVILYLYSTTWGHGPGWHCDRESSLYEVVRTEFNRIWEVNAAA